MERIKGLVLVGAVLVSTATLVAGVINLPVTEQVTATDYRLQAATAQAGEARAEAKLITNLKARGMRNIQIRMQGGVRIVNADMRSGVSYEQVGF